MSQKRTWNFWAGAAILLLFCGYAFWNAQDLLGGSELAVSSPETVTGDFPVTFLSGKVSRATTHLTVNGSPVLTDERGDWRSEQLLRPGRNLFIVQTEDRFGETEVLERVVWYLPTDEESPEL